MSHAKCAKYALIPIVPACILASLIVAFAAMAQQPAGQPASQPPPIPKGALQSSVPAETNEQLAGLSPCQLVFCDTDPRKALVLNADGKVIVDARSLSIEMPAMGKTPRVSCQVYAGPYAPTRPLVREWRLLSLKFATPEEFQKLVDQADTEFVESLKKPAAKPAEETVGAKGGA